MAITTAYFNGGFTPLDEVRISPDDRGFLFADGVYEVIRSYGGRLFAMQSHLDRMATGLRTLRITGVNVPDLAEVSTQLLLRNGLAERDALIYLQVTRGAAPRGHAFPSPGVAPTVYARVMPFVAKGDPATGIATITVPDMRWSRCDIKSVALLPNCLANQQARDAGAQEAILVRDGVAIEGTATSFFGVFNGTVRTAPESNYILPGVTRRVVLELCREHGIEATEQPIFVEELEGATELFLTGTTVEVMPIFRMDGRLVGDGHPGSIARRLLQAFRARTLAPTPLSLDG
jgi:D-alanine transaminase